MPFVTIFTPTYNRAYTLPRLYESLVNQTDTDFEWVVVDDGSTDDTAALFEQWIAENRSFPIRYVPQENAGKMQAVNKGVGCASGRMFWIVDSDDYLPEHAVATIKRYEGTIAGQKGFAGVAGCKHTTDGNLTGSTFDGEYLDASSLERRKYKILGDKAEVFYTDVIKRYPFPSFEGEKFVPEALIFNRIANDGYKFRWFNSNIYFCEYLPDGYTSNVNSNLIRNWQGYSLYVKELLFSKAALREKIIPLCGYLYRCILRGVKR